MIAAHVVAVLYDVSGQGTTIFAGLQPAHIPLFAFGALDQGTLLSKTAFVIANGLGALAGPAVLLQQSGGKRGAVVETNVPEVVGPVQQIAPAFYKNAGATLDAVPIDAGTADMTPQIQAELNKNPDQVSIVGLDNFCISALQALNTLGYTKQIVVDASCVSSATKKALGSKLKGVVVLTDTSSDPATHEVALYNAVMATYAPGTASNPNTQGGFAVLLSFARAMAGMSGAITPATVMSTAVAMQPAPIPLTKGLSFQCNQMQVSFAPAICSTGYLQTTLDSSGNPTTFKPIDLSAILKL
jgi:branched-chain amino acid transport system substrate-binding protein